MSRAVGIPIRLAAGAFRAKRETYWLLARELGESGSGIAEHAVEWVRSERDRAWPAAQELSEELGIEREWCLEKLHQGDWMGVAFVPDATDAPKAAAIGWVGTGSLLVDPLRQVCAHSHLECSFYNDLVRPEFRGRGLQRLLIQARMLEARRRGIRWGWAVVNATNRVSLKNYLAQGFGREVRADVVSAGGRMAVLFRRTSARNGINVRFDGWPVRGYLHACPRAGL